MRYYLAKEIMVNRLAAAVLTISLGLQGCGSPADEAGLPKDAAEFPGIKAEELVGIDIILRRDPRFSEVVYGKRGFINLKGEIIIPPRFDYCSSYGEYRFGGQDFAKNGLLIVDDNGKFGYMNTRGEMVIPARFPHAEGFTANGLAVVKEENGKFGYINAKGEMEIPARFEEADSFGRNGLAFVEDDEGWGFINDRGEKVIKTRRGFWSPKMTFAANGLAAEQVDPKTWKYVTATGESAFPGEFWDAGVFADNGLAAVSVVETDPKDGAVLLSSAFRMGFINSKGEMAIPMRFREAYDFSNNGLAAVLENEGGNYGYINAQGEMVIPAKFTDARTFADNGLAAVAVKVEGEEWSRKWGYINSKGEMVIDPRFDKAGDFSKNGAARVEENGKVRYIDTKGQTIVYIDEVAGRKVVKNARDEVIWTEEGGK
jgi:rRNA maturation protein Nop10/predicted DNA-binding WGR domain protein